MHKLQHTNSIAVCAKPSVIKYQNQGKWKSKPRIIRSDSSSCSSSSSSSSIYHKSHSKKPINSEFVIKVDMQPKDLNQPSTTTNRQYKPYTDKKNPSHKFYSKIPKTPNPSNVSKGCEYNKIGHRFSNIQPLRSKRNYSENMAEPNLNNTTWGTPKSINLQVFNRRSALAAPPDYTKNSVCPNSLQPVNKQCASNKTAITPNRICQNKNSFMTRPKVNDIRSNNNRNITIATESLSKRSESLYGIPKHTAARAEHRKSIIYKNTANNSE